MPKRRLTGIVISVRMAKTIVVQTERFVQHKKYLRRVRLHKKYKAHDEKREYHVGDKVIIEETRPLSKDKRWVVMGKI